MTPKSDVHAKLARAPLADLKKGQGGTVVRVLTVDRDILKKYAAMGIFPGVGIKLIQRSPSFLFQIGRSQFAVDKALASKIEIEIAG